MKNQTVILLIVACACGLVTMLGVKQYLARQNQNEEIPKVKVLVATVPIKQGVPLTEQNTQFITVPKETCPEGVVTDLEQIRERSLKVPRGEGDWIKIVELTERGATGAVTSIPKGMRVVTIPVDATTIHSGMLQPGNRIDLLLTYRERDPTDGLQKETTIPLMEYVEVFAVDSQKFGIDSSAENAKARNISLLVDTEQMMKLALAKRKGSISTALRSSEDLDKMKLAGMNEDSLNGNPPGKINTRSTLDVLQEAVGQPAFSLPPQPDIMSQLQSELEPEGPSGSGPVPQVEDKNEKDEFWTMAIYQAGTVRVEKVNMKSDEPVDTTDSAVEAGPADPVSRLGNDISLGETPSGADESGMKELEEAASGLLDLFN